VALQIFRQRVLQDRLVGDPLAGPRFVTRGEPPQAPVLRMVEAHAQCMDLAASVRGVACARTRVTVGDAVIDSAIDALIGGSGCFDPAFRLNFVINTPTVG
jgi:hypothetical protein